jgi:hypothetical protein
VLCCVQAAQQAASVEQESTKGLEAALAAKEAAAK